MSALRSDFFGVNSSNPIRLALDTKDYRPQIVNDNYFVILDNVLTPRQCQKLIAAAEQNTKLGWNAVVECEEGMEVRKCQRIMWDNQEIVTELWAKIESTVPELLHRRDGTIAVGSRKMVRLNERMRFLKYQKGEYFDAHPDCYYETDNGYERSYITLLLFLNDQATASQNGEFRGGDITFHSQNLDNHFDIPPKAGRVVLFEQEHLLHSGRKVTEGIKYAMRTDLMYEV